MTGQVIYPHILKASPDEPAHLERVPRVRVAQIVMDYLAYGWSVEEMARQHPYLTLGELHGAMAYYFDHQEEMDAEIRSEWEQAEREKSLATPSFFLAAAAGCRTGEIFGNSFFLFGCGSRLRFE